MNAHSHPAELGRPFWRRWRFSLGTLLLSTALLMAVISHIRTSYSLAQLRRESYGLEVGLRDRIYVRKLPQASFSLWQWKAHIPSRNRFRINLAIEGIGNSSFPEPIVRDKIEFEGEVTINVIEHETGERPFAKGVTVTVKQDNTTRGAAFVRLPRHATGGIHSIAPVGLQHTESFAHHEPVVLLRGTYTGFIDDRWNAHAHGKGERGTGILVWIDQIPAAKP